MSECVIHRCSSWAMSAATVVLLETSDRLGIPYLSRMVNLASCQMSMDLCWINFVSHPIQLTLELNHRVHLTSRWGVSGEASICGSNQLGTCVSGREWRETLYCAWSTQSESQKSAAKDCHLLTARMSKIRFLICFLRCGLQGPPLQSHLPVIA